MEGGSFTRLLFLLTLLMYFNYVDANGVLVNDVLIQVRMGPFVSCSSATTWTEASENGVSNFFKLVIAGEVNERCQCNFNTSKLINGIILCDENNPTYPTFRVVLKSQAQISANTLADYVDEWVSLNPLVTNGLATFSVDSECPVYPNAGDDLCTESEVTATLDTGVLIGALMAEFIILMIIFFVSIAVLLSICSNRQKKQRIALKRLNSRKRLNSGLSHESVRSDMRMHSCEAYATPIIKSS